MLSTLTLLKSINWFFLQLKNKKCIRFDLKNSLCNQISTRFVLFIYKIINEKQMWFGQFTFSVVWWLAINLINYLNRGNIVDKRPQQQYRLRQLLFHCKNLIIRDCKKKSHNEKYYSGSYNRSSDNEIDEVIACDGNTRFHKPQPNWSYE